MPKLPLLIAASVGCLCAGSLFALAQQQNAPPHPMSFFVTSVGLGHGANLGGLAGADAHCRHWQLRPGQETAPGVPISVLRPAPISLR